MKLELSGKTALVTGSSKGIGWAIAKVLHEEGCRVALNGRNDSDLALAEAQLAGAIGVVGDVTKPREARRVVSETLSSLGHLDILICNVGSGRSVPPGNENAEEWNRVFALNLWSTTNMVEAAKSALIASKGNIVCISSICALEAIAGAPVTYSAAKAALHAYVRGIARPLSDGDARINAVALGNILFEGSVWAKKIVEDKEKTELMLQNDVPLGRFGTPLEVANLVVYLASSRSAFSTGGIWKLDGGQTCS
jgi:3-oxoacyl-[acyl-carrier protein] reductase